MIDRESKYLCDSSVVEMPKSASYNELAASADWVEMYGESNLVYAKNVDLILVLHQGVWTVVDLS